MDEVRASGTVSAVFQVTGRGWVFALSEFTGAISIGDMISVADQPLGIRKMIVRAVEFIDHARSQSQHDTMTFQTGVVVSDVQKDDVQALVGARILFTPSQ